MHAYIHTYIQGATCIQTDRQTYIHIHTYIHADTHTHIQTNRHTGRAEHNIT